MKEKKLRRRSVNTTLDKIDKARKKSSAMPKATKVKKSVRTGNKGY